MAVSVERLTHWAVDGLQPHGTEEHVVQGVPSCAGTVEGLREQEPPTTAEAQYPLAQDDCTVGEHDLVPTPNIQPA